MIPSNEFTTIPVVSAFLPPNDEPYRPLTQTVMGGIAIGNITGGMNVKRWVVYYENNTINIKQENGSVAFMLDALDVETISLAFDATMSVVLAWKTSTGVKLYYRNSVTSLYTTKDIVGATSCRVTRDKNLDMVFAFTSGNSLYYMYQNDNYTNQFLIASTVNKLIKLGFNLDNRLQFELEDLISAIPYLTITNVPLTIGSSNYSLFNNIVTNVAITLGGATPIVFVINDLPILLSEGTNTLKTALIADLAVVMSEGRNTLKTSLIADLMITVSEGINTLKTALVADLPISLVGSTPTEQLSYFTSVLYPFIIEDKFTISSPAIMSTGNLYDIQNDNLGISSVNLISATLVNTIIYKTNEVKPADTLSISSVTLNSATLVDTIIYKTNEVKPVDTLSITNVNLTSATLVETIVYISNEIKPIDTLSISSVTLNSGTLI